MAPSENFADDLTLALELADLADAVSLSRFRALDLAVESKPDRTPVTDADRATERAILDKLAAARPDDAVFGEEFGRQGDAARTWIIDPIDGTAAFLRGVPTWGTLIALVVDDRPVVGVVSCPALGHRWWGTRDAAWVRHPDGASEPLRVSGVSELADASISYNNIQGWDGIGRAEEILDLTRRVWRARAIGDVWSYMLVAEGAVDAVAEVDLQPYDIAAIEPIVVGAGGRMTAISGAEGPFHGTALATNGALHEALLAELG